jgi:hypothetical protein
LQLWTCVCSYRNHIQNSGPRLALGAGPEGVPRSPSCSVASQKVDGRADAVSPPLVRSLLLALSVFLW